MFCLLEFRDVDGSMLMELVSIVVLLERILLNMLLVIIMLNCFGVLISCIVVLLMYMWDSFMFGYL